MSNRTFWLLGTRLLTAEWTMNYLPGQVMVEWEWIGVFVCSHSPAATFTSPRLSRMTLCSLRSRGDDHDLRHCPSVHGAYGTVCPCRLEQKACVLLEIIA